MNKRKYRNAGYYLSGEHVPTGKRLREDTFPAFDLDEYIKRQVKIKRRLRGCREGCGRFGTLMKGGQR